jgi:hypothetical protein
MPTPKPQRNKLIKSVAEDMYDKCYHGHIPWENWLKFAEYAVNYCEANGGKAKKPQ